MNIQLSISLLASGRTGSLKRCLESLKPLLQKIPSELIVVFTGTDEKVREIAAEYTDHIIPFTWCDDFSKARNAGLKEAAGEWFLYIDDDEWFEDVDEICSFFLSGEYRNYTEACYIQRNYTDWSGTKFQDFPAVRMAKRVTGLRFQNPIHEELNVKESVLKYLNSYVHHYGYARDRSVDAAQKSNRNIPLLLEDIKKNPQYLKNYIQLVKEYYTDAMWDEAEEICVKGREFCPPGSVGTGVRWLQVYYARILCKQGNVKEALKKIEELLEKERPCELVRLILYHLLVNLCAENRMPEKAVEYGKMFENLLDRMEKTPALWDEQQAGDVTKMDVTEPDRLFRGRMNCVASALETGKYEQAEFFLRKLPWEDEYLIQKHYPILDNWKKTFKPQVQEMLTGLPFTSPYLLVQKALAGENREKDFKTALTQVEDSYLRLQLLHGAFREGWDFSPLLKSMDLDTWKWCAKLAVAEISYQDLTRVRKAWEPFKEDYPLQWLWMQKELLEKELMQGYYGKEQLLDTMEAYCGCILEFYGTLYKEAFLEEANRSLLPAECKFAFLSREALEQLSGGQMIPAVKNFRKALEFYPELSGVVRELLRQLQAEKPSQSGNPEFQQLAVQMKAAVNTMLENRQYQEAMAIITQLTPLLPDDLEFLKLRQRLFREISS